MTMQLPENWAGDPDADPNEVLGVVMKEAATFWSGLGIYYPSDALLNVMGFFERHSDDLTAAALGRRVPDVPLQKPGTFESTRLHKATPNIGIFYIIVFAGNPSETGSSIQDFATAIDRSVLCDKPWLRYLIIPKTLGPSAYEILGIDPSFARVLYDRTGEAHDRYAVDVSKGAIFVHRPDGWIGTVAKFQGEAVRELETYFSRFMSLLLCREI